MTEPVKEKKKVGRKTKLDPQVTKTICEAVERGNTVKNAAALAGIGETTLYQWLEWGREGRPDYQKFQESLNNALAKAQDRAVKAFVGAFSNDPKMALEYLSRRYPEDWAKKDNLKVESKVDGVIKIVVEEVDGGRE
jgi:hypothetical protein